MPLIRSTTPLLESRIIQGIMNPRILLSGTYIIVLAYIHRTPSTDMAGEPRKQVGNEHVPDCTHSCTEDSRERNTSPYKEIGPVIGVDGNNSTAFNMNGSEFSWWTVDCGLWTVVSGGGPIFRGWRILLPGESGVWGCTV